MNSRSAFRRAAFSHPSKYWASAKLLDLGDRLIPDTYHTPNAVNVPEVLNFHVYENKK